MKPKISSNQSSKIKFKFSFFIVLSVRPRYGVLQTGPRMEVRGGRQLSKVKIVSAEAPGPGPELLPGKETEEPAALGLLPG